MIIIYKSSYKLKIILYTLFVVLIVLAIQPKANNYNQPYQLNKNSFKNTIDNFMTPDTWYRPKKVYDNGTTWRNSKANEYRPLLTTWWPNQKIEENYLKFMKQHHFINANQISQNDAPLIIQKNLEKKISNKHSVQWLKKLMQAFVNSQSDWNQESESKEYDDFQNGYMTYSNSRLTPNANSNYRLLNRNSLDQNGLSTYKNQSAHGELLLANDLDNSNPVVQSEQLNLLHYIMNYGSLNETKGKSEHLNFFQKLWRSLTGKKTKQPENIKNANFDGIRFDAPDQVDADLLQIAGIYFKNVFHVNQSDKVANRHLSILEDWNPQNRSYTKKQGNQQLTIDLDGMTALNSALTYQTSQRASLETLISSGLQNKQNDTSSNQVVPNYLIVNSHNINDLNSRMQTLINKNEQNGNQVIKKKMNQLLKRYNQDLWKTKKTMSQYNVPSAYALALTNKNTVPRVYYGDMYLHDADFMSKKTPYFDAIKNLLVARKKYVSGPQTMQTQTVNGQSILTSTRTGKSQQRTQGIGIALSNNPKVNLSQQSLTLPMGSKHKNQLYRPLMMNTKNGLKSYSSDQDAKQLFKQTDQNGDLHLNQKEFRGSSNPFISGALSIWVPVGASQTQASSTKPSNKKNHDRKVFHSNAALDSNVIFEGFSSFQTNCQKPSAYQKIAQNAQFFADLGFTYYEFPPAYRSSKGNSFVDETIQNGYAIKDRYDFGYQNPTKYGTEKELRQAISALHSKNVYSMADYVPNQVYQLPKSEVVKTTRSDMYGNYYGNGSMKDVLYAAKTKSSGDDYQAKFGGKYLSELKQKYPAIFNQKQISTGKTIDSSGTKIKTWSAKYFNGSNVQNRGAGYVLHDQNGRYYRLDNNLPKNYFNGK